MQMSKPVMTLILASIAMVATLALVGLGLSHAQAMRENAVSMGSTGGHMSQDDRRTYDENMSSPMNVNKHMGGNTYSAHEDMHNQLNMTEHMQDMHEEDNMTAPHNGKQPPRLPRLARALVSPRFVHDINQFLFV